ncbi:MAG: phosphotransferase [Caldilinea sp.]|uniref:phosphotransferase n=1 Tax=Caldilinea sp. TaxID=2293560 RepID=UPI0030B5F7DD
MPEVASHGKTLETSFSQARLLIVDNRGQTRRDLLRAFEAEGYSVVVAEGAGDALRKDALRLAQKTRPHVIIVDLRLDDDHDTSDISGLELLRRLRSLGKNVGLIVYSGYLNPTVDRAIAECGARWVNKDDSPDVLRNEVEKLATQSCAARRRLQVFWQPKPWSRERTVRRLFRRWAPTSLLDDLIAQLFEDRRRVWVYPIEGKLTSSAMPASRGRSLVLRARIHQGKAQKVVKIAKAHRVAHESKNYKKYIASRALGQFHTRLETTAFFWDAGASVYSFLGEGDVKHLQAFRSFYAAEQDIDRLLKPIRFWRDLWRQAFPRFTTTTCTIFEAYDKLLGLNKQLARLREHPVGLPAELPQLLQRIHDRMNELSNWRGARWIVHGDFHADNLFTDGDHLWLIDFERTGPGPAYADFCELEIDVVTRLLPSTVSSQDFLTLTQALIDFDAADEPPGLSWEAYKALKFVRALRKLAFETTNRQNQLPDYLWGLLCDALFVAGMRPRARGLQEQMIQRERAWLYASALSAQIDAVQPAGRR